MSVARPKRTSLPPAHHQDYVKASLSESEVTHLIPPPKAPSTLSKVSKSMYVCISNFSA